MGALLGKIEAALGWNGTKWLALGLLGSSLGMKWWDFVLLAIVLVGFFPEDERP